MIRTLLMRVRERIRNTRASLWHAPYFLVLCAPNLLLHHYEADDVSFVFAALAILIIAFIHIGFAWSRWVIALMFPVFLLLPFDFYYTWHYHEVLTPRVLAIALQTPNEQIHSYVLPRLPTLGAMLAMSLLVWTLAFVAPTRDDFVSRQRKWFQWCCVFGLASFIAAGSLTVYKAYFKVQLPSYADSLTVVGQLVQGTFPLGRVMTVARYVVESNTHSAVLAQRRAKQVSLARGINSVSSAKSVVVLVIGESSNRDHWGLFGYHRDTTPHLSVRKGLIPLPDLVSSWPSTLMSVPVMLSTKSATDISLYSKEPSVIAVLRQAGFATYWLSTQGSIGVFDRSISDFADDAEFRQFILGPTALRPGQPGDDAQLLPLIDAGLKSAASKLFIVLHTQGSHFPYWERYPKEFAQFQPTPKSFHFKDWKNDTAHREALTNSYDNSILYTDHLLNQVIERLESSDRQASVLYASDHGESLPTAQCDRFGHGFKSASNFKIPGLIWLNLRTMHARPKLFEQLSRTSKMRLTSSSIFSTLLDLAEVQVEGVGDSKSLASTAFTEQARLVNAPKPVDFDRGLVTPTGCQ